MQIAKKFPGTLFLVVGNSGSGKDSIISGIIKAYPPHLKQIYAPKRFITRLPSKFEKNISITPEKFKEMDKSETFVLKWHIYGLDYGIHKEIDDYLKDGHPVVINVSRKIVKQAREKYEKIKVIFIDVPFEITYQRVKDRKRESEDLLKERIERAKKNQHYSDADYTVDNSGDLNNAINQFLFYLLDVINEKEKEKN